MGNHYDPRDEDEKDLIASEHERAIRDRWDNLPAEQKVFALERSLAMVNERAVSIRDQIGHGNVLADLRHHLHVIVEVSRNYRSQN